MTAIHLAGTRSTEAVAFPLWWVIRKKRHTKNTVPFSIACTRRPNTREEMLRTEALKNGAGHGIGSQIGRTDLARQVGETNKALRCALPTRPGAAGGPLPPPETLHCSAFSDRSLGTRPPPLRVAGSPPLGTEEAAPVTGSQALPEALAATAQVQGHVLPGPRVPEAQGADSPKRHGEARPGPWPGCSVGTTPPCPPPPPLPPSPFLSPNENRGCQHH